MKVYLSQRIDLLINDYCGHFATYRNKFSGTKTARERQQDGRKRFSRITYNPVHFDKQYLNLLCHWFPLFHMGQLLSVAFFQSTAGTFVDNFSRIDLCVILNVIQKFTVYVDITRKSALKKGQLSKLEIKAGRTNLQDPNFDE